MKLIGESSPFSREEIQRILDSQIPYTKHGDKEAQQCKDLVATLSPGELEVAAQSSYAYWLASISDQPPTEEERLHMALREARRHLFKVPYDKACIQMKDTIRYRKERRIDRLRACFFEEGEVIDYENDAEDEATAGQLRAAIASDLSKQLAFVRGHDREGRALMILHPRLKKGTDDEEFVATVLYLMERAIACTEAHTVGAEEKILVVLDFKDFKSSLAPSLQALKKVSVILQNRYPERLKKLVVLDPPFWMRTTYALLSPFLDPETKAKFILVSGSEHKKHKVLGEVIDEDQAMPFMLPNGKLTDPVEVEYYLNEVPFHEFYAKKQYD